MNAVMKSHKAWLKKAVRRLQKDRLLRNVIVFFVMCLGLILLFVNALQTSQTQTTQVTQSNPLGITQLEQGTPEYPTLVPAGKTIEALGGWTRVSPRERNPVFAYNDTIDGKSVNVSQQPVPEELKGDIDEQIADIALDFRATEKFTAADTTIYIGVSSNGPQFIIFTKDDLLILMRSGVPIAIEAWAAYINSLV
jgi:hypothetical protein